MPAHVHRLAAAVGLLLFVVAVPVRAVEPTPSTTPVAAEAIATPSPTAEAPAPTPAPTAAATASIPSGAPVPSAAATLSGAHGSSIHAEMLSDHAGDQVALPPGGRPEPLSEPASDGPSTMALAGDTAALPNGLRREVFGYLPYWMLNSDKMAYLDYSLVSTVAYFSVGARANGTLAKTTSTGEPTSGWAGWTSAAMTEVINRAHQRGVTVVLTVTMMAWNHDYSAMSTLLASSTNRARLAAEIATAITARNADGVNLDFEPVPTTLRDQYTAFTRELKAQLVRQGAGSYLTVATMAGAATWETGYDVAALSASGAADALMVMAYDFNWSGSARAGGVAPIDSPYVLDSRTALEDHLALVPASKLIWGVPYYGREWSTDTGERYSLTNDTLTSEAGTYVYHIGAAGRHGRNWDPTGQVPWYAFRHADAGTWVQGYYDDATSLTVKYDMVNRTKLRGIGIWHLLMDGSRPELWTAIDASFQGAWFEDIIGSSYRADILWIAEAGITAGCGPELFCPKNLVTREQMASFLARALALPNSARDWFVDDESTTHEGDINRIADAGISRGCGEGRFCPSAVVTREQMASFLARALRLPAASRDYFIDDDGSSHEGDINRLAAAGITGGCSAGHFCPLAGVTREQMAAFLHRALGS